MLWVARGVSPDVFGAKDSVVHGEGLGFELNIAFELVTDSTELLRDTLQLNDARAADGAIEVVNLLAELVFDGVPDEFLFWAILTDGLDVLKDSEAGEVGSLHTIKFDDFCSEELLLRLNEGERVLEEL